MQFMLQFHCEVKSKGGGVLYTVQHSVFIFPDFCDATRADLTEEQYLVLL